jgi:hypothetical protein
MVLVLALRQGSPQDSLGRMPGLGSFDREPFCHGWNSYRGSSWHSLL